MFKYVHHVDYAVRNRDEMVAYLERNFGMRPDKLLEGEGGRWKEAQYHVGPTLIQIREHAPGTNRAQFIEEHGPGVHHVAWGVDNISEMAQQLKAEGITLRDEQGFHHSSQASYYTMNIDPKDALGIYFQISGELK